MTGLNKSIEASLGDIPQIASLHGLLACTEMVILDIEPNRFTPFLSMHKHIGVLSVSKHRMTDNVNTWSPQGWKHYLHAAMQKSCTASKALILQGHYSRLTEGKELIYIRSDMVRKTHLINQCYYLDLNCSQHSNMASSSLFLICFFRNTSLLSFHVANADGYHSRVNTQAAGTHPNS